MKTVKLIINGIEKKFVVEKDRVLLDILREDLHLTGAKQSCDRKGQCGSCTVIVNGKARKSCLQKAVNLDGAEIITVEGLGTSENPHLIQEAFVLSGAIQCGFCMPGMIMGTKALLDRSTSPTQEEIKKALSRNICRCTGYTKIFDAIKLAGEFLRGEKTPDEVRPDPDGPKIGVSHPRPTSLAKACGEAEFTADIKLQGALEIAVTHSTEAHALIRDIDTTEAEGMPGVVGVMTARDIKGSNRIRVMFSDQPVLCDTKVHLLGAPIVIVAAGSRDQARAAAAAVKVTYEPLPVLKTTAEAMAPDAVQIHEEIPNVCFSQPQIKGDAAKALAEAAAVIEGEFSTQLNHQAALEPEASIAYLEDDEEEAQLVVVGRSIDIHTHMRQLQDAVGYENMRYEEAFAGGQFGIKLAISTEAIAAAAALHFQKAVRYIPSLHESMMVTTKRHPFNLKIRLGADADGKLTVYTNDMTVNNGAYSTIGPYIIFRVLWMLSSAYHIPNIDAQSRLVYTNDGFGGAARGAGPPQGAFALECAMDMLAEKVGMDPLEFRKINALQAGQTKSTGRTAEQWPFTDVCDAIKPSYDRAVKEAACNKTGTVKRGVGLGASAFGISSPGDTARVSVELNEDNGITIFAAVADPGEGNDAMLAQIAANLLDIPMAKIRLEMRSTENTVNTGSASGSRMTFMAGGALMDAISQLQEAMQQAGGKTCKALKDKGLPLRYMGKKQAKEKGPLDKKTGQGPSFESEVHSIQMAEVEVNTETGDVKVVKVTTAVDAGTVINPHALEGQLEGGMDQGVGYALREEYIHGKTKDWLTFKFPTFKTTFDMDVIVNETHRNNGPLGATGVGEMSMVSTAPAVINAIYNACGARVFNLPATPEKVKAALNGQ